MGLDLLLEITRTNLRLSGREFVPNVIEPSFGIGRILYSLLEHSYWSRPEDVDRRVSRSLQASRDSG